jgi:hypothetical protein
LATGYGCGPGRIGQISTPAGIVASQNLVSGLKKSCPAAVQDPCVFSA